MNNINTTLPEETQNLTSKQRRVRVKFVYSSDNDQILPITQTTVIKTAPCFKVTATEDEDTKQFYKNKSQISSKQHQTNQLIKQRTLSEPDSLEDEYSPKFIVSHSTINKNIFFMIDSFRKKKKQLIMLNNLLLIEQVLLHR
jgi:hypothetical protein